MKLWTRRGGLDLVVLVCGTLVGVRAAEGLTIRIDDDAQSNGPGNLTDWSNAFNNLQDALAFARIQLGDDTIMVAQGIYTPDQGANQTPGNRFEKFQLDTSANGLIVLKGGHAGLT